MLKRMKHVLEWNIFPVVWKCAERFNGLFNSTDITYFDRINLNRKHVYSSAGSHQLNYTNSNFSSESAWSRLMFLIWNGDNLSCWWGIDAMRNAVKMWFVFDGLSDPKGICALWAIICSTFLLFWFRKRVISFGCWSKLTIIYATHIVNKILVANEGFDNGESKQLCKRKVFAVICAREKYSQ